jgi:thiol-disulfide isomerase/thioredoxin
MNSLAIRSMNIPSLSIRSFFPVLVLLFLEIPAACYCQAVKEPKADSTELYYSEAARISDPFITKIPADSLLLRFPLPTIQQMEISPSAVTYLRYYLIARFRYLGMQYRKDSVSGKLLISRELGLPFDSVMSLGALYGDDYILTLCLRKKFAKPIQEYYLAERIGYYCKEQYYETARKIYADYSSDFPQGQHAAACREQIGKLQEIMARNERNPEIVFRTGTRKAASIEQILAPYKGKCVYLDIWGTWCGPCREEMQFVPALKEHFSGKDIVFLYLDMDEDRQDEKWKNLVRLKNITGQHLRLNGQDLEKVWQVVTPGGNGARFYPSYFIFDRSGKQVPLKTARPSDKQVLYQQLEDVLKQ